MTTSYLFRDLSVVRDMISFQNEPCNHCWKKHYYCKRTRMYIDWPDEHCHNNCGKIDECRKITEREDWKNKHWKELFESDPWEDYYKYTSTVMYDDGLIVVGMNINYKSMNYCSIRLGKLETSYKHRYRCEYCSMHHEDTTSIDRNELCPNCYEDYDKIKCFL